MMGMEKTLNELAPFFTKPAYSFGGYIDARELSKEELFRKATVVFWDLPFELTSTGGRTSAHGAEAVRLMSAKQIEFYDTVSRKNIFSASPWFDLGTFPVQIPERDENAIAEAIADPDAEITGLSPEILRTIEKYLAQIGPVKRINSLLLEAGKISFPFIGEHYPSALLIKGIVESRKGARPLKIIHWDAHRDMKKEYLGMRRCHTTPFFEILEVVEGQNLMQIGIRQAGEDEDQTAEEHGVVTFHWKDIHKRFSDVLKGVREFSKGADIYFSIDIDALDAAYTTATGTPVPGGITPVQAVDLIEAIDPSARLVGADIAEVGYRGDKDYREAILGWWLAQQILLQPFVKRLEKI